MSDNVLRLRNDKVRIEEDLETSSGLQMSSTGHEIIGSVEILVRGKRGSRRFTRTLHKHNDLLIGGANFISEKMNNMRSTFNPTPLDIEVGYHTQADVVVDSTTIKEESIVGMTIGIDGCVNTYNTVKPVQRHSRVVPGMIPFRKMTLEDETLLKSEVREKYFMRYVDNAGYVNYYGKKFDAEPAIYTMYEDGTEVPQTISEVAEPKAIKHFTKYLLTIEGEDVREYFRILDRSTVNSKVNSAGLVTAYGGLTADGLNPEWFNVRQMTTLNFENQELKDSETMITFIYRLNIR